MSNKTLRYRPIVSSVGDAILCAKILGLPVTFLPVNPKTPRGWLVHPGMEYMLREQAEEAFKEENFKADVPRLVMVKRLYENKEHPIRYAVVCSVESARIHALIFGFSAAIRPITPKHEHVCKTWVINRERKCKAKIMRALNASSVGAVAIECYDK